MYTGAVPVIMSAKPFFKIEQNLTQEEEFNLGNLSCLVGISGSSGLFLGGTGMHFGSGSGTGFGWDRSGTYMTKDLNGIFY
jgi:hypothetical protein